MSQSKKRILDTYLVEFARLGDRAAQEQLVLRFQKQFLGHAYRLLGDAELAKEAVQEGWIEIVRGISKLRDASAFSAWSFRIITRRCARQIAGLQRERQAHQTMAEDADPGDAEGEGLEQIGDRQLIQKALATLSEKQRAAVTLFYLQDMSIAEIAVSLDIPVGTIKTRLMSARNKMRAALQGDNHG